MYVDVVTYLFNYMAERMKHEQRDLPWGSLQLRRLFLELIPPLVSVTTLVVVTVSALSLAMQTLSTSDEKYRNPPDVGIMLLFSALNLLLDFLNVSFFARADQAVGLPGQHGYEHVDGRHHEARGRPAIESTALLDPLDDDESSQQTEDGGLNLNMCSAWTHICADTLRSVAVLLAAGFSFFFPILLSPVDADAWGSIVVSVIILVSLGPLVQGLYLTSKKIRDLWHDEGVPKEAVVDAA